MAIVIEEEHKSSNIVGILTWVLVLGTVLAAAYYLFFKRPELIPVPVPQSLENTQSLSYVNTDVEKILEDPSFKLLKDSGISPNPQNAGRQNPLLGF